MWGVHNSYVVVSCQGVLLISFRLIPCLKTEMRLEGDAHPYPLYACYIS